MKSFTHNEYSASLRFLEFDGEGAPLLMLHGLGCASSFEYPSLARSGPLAERRLLLLDMFGFGYSDQPMSFGYRVEDHAKVVAEFATTMSLGRFDLYGHSMGGTVAIEAATLLGDQVGNLILSEANLDSGGGQFSKDIASAGEEEYASHIHADTIASAARSGNQDWAATMRFSAPRAVYFGALSLVEGGKQSWRELLYQHPAQKSFIFGEKSLPNFDLEKLPMQGVEAFVVPDAGHSMGTENPTGLAECIGQAAKPFV